MDGALSQGIAGGHAVLRFPVAPEAVHQRRSITNTLSTRFSNDRLFPVSARASLAQARGSAGGAIAAYDRAFDPLWPEQLQSNYYQLLIDGRRLRDFLAQSRAAAQASPEDIAPAGRIYFYYRRSGNMAAARRALLEYRLRKKSPWKAA